MSAESILGRLKAAIEPTPLLKAATPRPLSVRTVQIQDGSEANPTVLHIAGGKQGRASGGLPPGQKNPIWQVVGEALVDPEEQPWPGAAAVHSPEQDDVKRLGDEPYLPAGHGIGAREPAGQKLPSGQLLQVDNEEAPREELKEPAGHSVGDSEVAGQ